MAKVSELIREATTNELLVARMAKIIKAAYANGKELATAIESAIKKHFPKSMLTVRFAPNKFKPTEGVIDIFFAVAGSKDEVVNKIIQNDISYTIIHIYGMDGEGNFKDKLSFEPSQGGKVVADPNWIKVGLRKKKGTPEQILKHTDNYFAKLLKTIKDNADNIPERNKSLLKSITL